jgi:hypothetical protein
LRIVPAWDGIGPSQPAQLPFAGPREGINQGWIAMLLLLINILIIVVVGAICFYLIDRFVRDRRLANLLKILVALICLAAIVQRLLPSF